MTSKREEALREYDNAHRDAEVSSYIREKLIIGFEDGWDARASEVRKLTFELDSHIAFLQRIIQNIMDSELIRKTSQHNMQTAHYNAGWEDAALTIVQMLRFDPKDALKEHDEAVIAEHTQTVMNAIATVTTEALVQAEMRGYERKLSETLLQVLKVSAES